MMIALSFLAFAGIVAFVVWCAAVLAGRADRELDDEQIYALMHEALKRKLSEYGATEGNPGRRM